jgi:thiol-disulfide isomerase/thioredoxin
MKQLIAFIFIFPFLTFGQSVKGTFFPAGDFTHAFLYEATPQGANYVNHGELNTEGAFEIKMDSSAAPGIYKIVYAIPPEENNFDFIYDGKETVAFNFSQDKGVEFTESDENKLWASYLKSMDMVNQTIANYYEKDGKDRNDFKAVFKVLKDTQTSYEALAKGRLASAFIIANRPYIPSEYEDITTYTQNIKTHFFDEVDFGNYILQSSTFLVDRVVSYVFNMVENPTDDIYKSLIDEVAKAIGDEDLVIKTYLLEVLWQRFVNNENHDIANYITNTYLLDLANKTGNKVLAETINSYKNTSIGTIAPNFEIASSEMTSSLHDLKGSEHYLLIFWSSSCSHCLNELPLVKKLVAEMDNLKVVAFGLEEAPSRWTQEIKKYPDFINTIGLGKWDNPIVKTYGVAATPTYFLLDKDKKIIAKPYDYSEVESALKAL